MDVHSYVRDVCIDRPLAEVVAFLRQVQNLPRWTGFFQKAGAQDGDFFAMETVMGPSKTRIEEEPGQSSHRLDIVSYFGPRRETATVEINARPRGSEVKFHLRLPASLPAPRKDKQLAQLEAELLALRRLLEADRHDSHAPPESLL